HGEVIGNVTTAGGDVRVRDGARVHGDLNAMGGQIAVSDGALVYGQVLSASDHAPARAAFRGSDSDTAEELGGLVRWGLWHVLLFLFGLVMLGTARERLSVLRAEIAARPVRSTLGGFFGAMAGVVLSVVLVLTLIG